MRRTGGENSGRDRWGTSEGDRWGTGGGTRGQVGRTDGKNM